MAVRHPLMDTLVSFVGIVGWLWVIGALLSARAGRLGAVCSAAADVAHTGTPNHQHGRLHRKGELCRDGQKTSVTQTVERNSRHTEKGLGLSGLVLAPLIRVILLPRVEQFFNVSCASICRWSTLLSASSLWFRSVRVSAPSAMRTVLTRLSR